MLDAAFLADIAENPDDDAPRLIYADWLDDHGDADRAEFIRVQVRIARLPQGAAEGRELRRAEGKLLAKHATTWRAALPALEGVKWGDFTRGFVGAARVWTADTFLAHAEAIFAAAPVRSLTVDSAHGPMTPPVARRLAASPHLGRLHGLDVGSCLPEAESARALLASPHFGSLSALLIHRNRLGDAVFPMLAAARLPRLEELYLSLTDVTVAGMAVLANADALPGITTLDLRDDSHSDETLEPLPDWACGRRLETLYLVNNGVGPGLATLARGLPGLRRLYAGHNPLGDEGARALAETPLTLREFDLRHCGIGPRALIDLARVLRFSPLERLWLAGNQVNGQLTWDELRRLLGPRLAG